MTLLIWSDTKSAEKKLHSHMFLRPDYIQLRLTPSLDSVSLLQTLKSYQDIYNFDYMIHKIQSSYVYYEKDQKVLEVI